MLMLPGSFKACTMLGLINVPGGQLCGLAALPVRLTCSTLAVKCYKQGCGILRFSLLHSHWSRTIDVLLSLVKRLIMLLCQQPWQCHKETAEGTQSPLNRVLWHMGGFHARKGSIISTLMPKRTSKRPLRGGFG